MQVGMLTAKSVATMFAFAAGFIQAFGGGTLAQQQLAEPKSQALFADAGWALEQQARRKFAEPNRFRESRADGGVAEDGAKGHQPIWARAGRARRDEPEAE